jgi:SulP family sulfate permease
MAVVVVLGITRGANRFLMRDYGASIAIDKRGKQNGTMQMQGKMSQLTRWRRFLPFLAWWPVVGRTTIRADLLAGITGAVVALPQGVAFATIAGMPPQYGLYTGMIPAVIAALFGSSWLLVSGPTTAASLVLFSSLSMHAEPGSGAYVQLALTVTFMVGLIQLSMGLVRFGSLVNFISHSVVVGFTAGAALLIIASQVKYVFGLSYASSTHFQDMFRDVLLNINDYNPYAMLVGGVTLASGALIKHCMPTFPYLLVAMVAGSLTALGLSAAFGAEHTNIAAIAALPATVPPLSYPVLTFENIKLLTPTAFAMALFALTEAISIARSLADRTGRELDGNQEFIGQGLSNIFGSFASGYVATGSFNRSGMNYEAGAKTPMAAIFAGLFLIPVVLFCAPLTAYLPKAALAGILFLVAWRLIDPQRIIKIARTSVAETIIVASTFFATLFLELQFAILLGILLSLAIYLNRTSHPHIKERVPNPQAVARSFVTDLSLPQCPQLKIVRIDGSLYFGAVNHVRAVLHELLAASPGQKHLLIVGSGINFIDMAGADFLVSLARERRAAGGDLYFHDMKEDVCSNFKFSGYLLEIGQENIFTSKKEAIQEIYQRLDRSVCNCCKARIFIECHYPVQKAV